MLNDVQAKEVRYQRGHFSSGWKISVMKSALVAILLLQVSK